MKKKKKAAVDVCCLSRDFLCHYYISGLSFIMKSMKLNVAVVVVGFTLGGSFLHFLSLSLSLSTLTLSYILDDSF